MKNPLLATSNIIQNTHGKFGVWAPGQTLVEDWRHTGGCDLFLTFCVGTLITTLLPYKHGFYHVNSA